MSRPQRTILIIDDSPEDRYTFERFLARDPEFDYRFVQVSSGAEARGKCEELCPDCILLDFVLPDMSGIEYLSELKGGDEMTSCPVVVLTGTGNETVAVEAMKHGALDYLVKGQLSADNLRRAINNAIEKAALLRERRNREAELRAVSAFQQTMLDSATYAIISTAPDGIIRTFNKAAEKLFGCAAEEVIGKDTTARFHDPAEIAARTRAVAEKYEVDVSDNLAALFACIQGNRTGEAEWTLIDCNGGRFTAHVTVSEIRDDDDKLKGYLGIVQDITERKRNAAEISRLAAIVEFSDDAIVGKNLDGTITNWNQGAERIFGYSAAEMVGRHISILFPPERLAEETLIQSKIRRSEYIAHYETIRIRKDGARIPVSLTVSPIKDGGEIIGISKIARDISASKKAEAEREEMLQRESELRSAAEQANRHKDEFLATLSHELRSPMNVIVGWSRMLRAGNLDAPTIARAVEAIDRNAQTQNRLIEDLLDVSRIITGKLHLELQPVELTRVLDAALEAARSAAINKGVKLNVALHATGVVVSGDASRLQQIISNLLNNAVKFTPAGGAINVELRRAKDLAEIIVGDTGEGIAPEFLPYVFDRFRQADGAHNRRHGGLGLGLSIVQHLTEMHGGTVAVNSAGTGRGATFTLRLPLLATTNKRNETVDGQFPADILTGVRVLFVDDEEDSRQIVDSMLTNYGAEVKVVGSAVEGLDALFAGQFDVLISDIGMPVTDGYKFIRQVRSIAPDGGGMIPAVALTAYANRTDETRALQEGYQAHLAKPIDVSSLITTILMLKTDSSQTAPPAAQT